MGLSIGPLRQSRGCGSTRLRECGRILARDGTVLAYDQPLVDLAVNYRWLQEPADPNWLLRMVRARLSSRERRDPAQLAQEEEKFLTERSELGRRLASLCGLTDDDWRLRTERVQQRIEAMAGGVNARRQSEKDARTGRWMRKSRQPGFPWDGWRRWAVVSARQY